MQSKLTQKQEETFYEIEAILEQKSVQGQTYYLLKWRGYPLEESTWEPAHKIAETSELFEQYQRNIRKKGPNFYKSSDAPFQPPPIEHFNKIKKKTKLELISDVIEAIQGIKESTEKIARHSLLLKNHQNPLQNSQNIITQAEGNQIKAQLVKQKKKPKQANTSQMTSSKIVVSQPESIKENIIVEENIQCNQTNLQSSASKKNQQAIVTCIKEEEPVYQILFSDFNKCGSFENGDQIDRIGKSVIIKETGQKQYFVLWKKRAEGYYPKSSWISSQELLEKDPKVICIYIKNVMRL